MTFRFDTHAGHQLRFAARPDVVVVLFGLPFLLGGIYFFVNLLAALGLLVLSGTVHDLGVRLIGIVLLGLMVLTFGLPALALITARRTVASDAAHGELVERSGPALFHSETRHALADAGLVVLRYVEIAPSARRPAGSRTLCSNHLNLVWTSGKSVNLALHDDADRLRGWGQHAASVLQIEFRDTSLADELQAHGAMVA